MVSLGKWLSFEHVWYVYLHLVYVLFEQLMCTNVRVLIIHTSLCFFVTLMTLCSKIKNLSPRSFLSVCPRVRKITPVGKSCGCASLKVVHLERLTAGVREMGNTGAGKFWVISDLWVCSLFLLILYCVSVRNKERKLTALAAIFKQCKSIYTLKMKFTWWSHTPVYSETADECTVSLSGQFDSVWLL